MKYLSKINSEFKKRRQALSSLLAVFFLIIIVFYIVENFQSFKEISFKNPYLLPVIFASVLVRNFSTGMVMDTVLRSLGIKLKLVESFGLANLTRLINQTTPGNVGIVMRSIYLKKKHNLAYASFVSSFAASQVVLYLISSLLGLFAIAVMRGSGVDINAVFIYILLGAAIFLGSILAIPNKFQHRIRHNRLAKAVSSWYEIRKDSRSLGLLFIWSLVFISASAIIMYSTFNSLGAHISIWIGLFFSSINIVNTLFSITPSGFGINESIIVILGHSVGIDAPIALTAALLQRAITFFAMLLVTPYFARKLFGASLWQLIRGQKQTPS